MASRPYDLIVYGASGFTGRYAAAETARTCGSGKKIALAGRSKPKLEKTLEFIKAELGGDFDKFVIGVIVADSSDDESILEMCRQGRVVINCVGPFRWYGEQVVAACVKTSTNYVDISGEPEFLQACQIKYHVEAKEKGIHIVGACGFDSIPADCGLEILRERFPGTLTAAESYIHLHGAGKANYGTYNTIIQSLANKSDLKAQQKEIFKNGRLPYVGSRLKPKGIGFSEAEGKWFVPFKGADPSVVRRTQLHESMVFGKTPIQYGAYFAVGSFLHLVGVVMFAINMFVFTRFKIGIKLLETFPRLFSFGVFSKDGVSKEDLYKSGFKIIFHGRGYTSTAKENGESFSGSPNQKFTLRISGPECGYIFTSSAVVAAACTLLEDRLPNKGGVLTPGSAFRGTMYVERLLKRGMKIESI